MLDNREWTRDGFTISTDRGLLDEETVFRYLSEESYWAKGISRELFRKSVAHSALCFGVYEGDPAAGQARQVGFARVVSDLATFAWLSDVFILPAYQGRGLGKWLIEVLVGHPDLQGLRRFLLATRDAHSLYARYGFRPLTEPERFMRLESPEP